MTDRVIGFTVVLEKDMRDDDVEHIRKALELIKGVITVENVIVTSDAILAQMRATADISLKLRKFINNGFEIPKL